MDDRALEDMESGISPNGGGNAARADDDKDDQTYVIALPDGTQEEIETFEVARTYSLDEAFFDMRPEDDQEESELSIGGDQRDPIRDYSFAFTMRRAYNDGSLGRDFAPRDRSLIPANELFEVEVLVYRSFRWNPDIDLKNEPILRTTFLVHK